VGSGPGSPSLLTLAAHSLITDPSNYIIVDRLVSDEILQVMDNAGVEYRIANKKPGCQQVAQDEIMEWCKEGLRQGRHVVRLKIGKCVCERERESVCVNIYSCCLCVYHVVVVVVVVVVVKECVAFVLVVISRM
jgi:siroheme synthase